jgi:hypothetical protein
LAHRKFNIAHFAGSIWVFCTDQTDQFDMFRVKPFHVLDPKDELIIPLKVPLKLKKFFRGLRFGLRSGGCMIGHGPHAELQQKLAGCPTSSTRTRRRCMSSGSPRVLGV